ncbi:MAG: family protein in fasciation locus [Pseudomonadota bacterium]|jgi:uncharacterized protein (TIGR00730 family)
MSAPAFSVTVYCGSRLGADPAFAGAAQAVGRWIGAHGGQLVYGGGHNGLMGLLADACLQAGGRVVGVIPTALVEREWAHRGCTELIVVDTMHERKRIMAERADAFVALPGGIGTFEEFFEAWTWRHLGYHSKPVGLLNTAGFYDDMLHFLGHGVESQFMNSGQMGMISVGDNPTTLLPQLVQAAGLAPAPRLDQI